LENGDKTIDGQIRIEKYKDIATKIYADLFASKVKDADEAHITSESFPWSDGAGEATKFLQENGFRVVVMIK
jgi:phosphoserine phosphatase